MGDKTKIQWSEATWNPLNGCSRISAGCMHCYAERQASRFSGAGQTYDGLTLNGKWTGNIRLNEQKLLDPIRWKRPRKIFVNSMSDLFHENVPDEWIDRIFAVMALAPQHTFQVLTKRPMRMGIYARMRDGMGNTQLCHAINDIPAKFGNRHGALKMPLPNVWLGVSVEDQKSADERIPLLLETPAAVRFVSYEPALGPVDFSNFLYTRYHDGGARHMYHKLDWLICGGESGPGARRFDPAWARSVVQECKAAGVACFVKQMGSNAVETEEDVSWPTFLNRKGDDPYQWPEELRVREFPR